MRNRSLSGALLLIGALIPVTSCSNSPSLTSITVTPSIVNFGGAGITSQLTAIGSYTHPGHPAITKDITAQVAWTSSASQCVTVSNAGLITSGQNICSGIQITATSQGFNGVITGSMIANVSQPGSSNSDVAIIVVSPANPAPLAVAGQLQFAATGFNASGTQVSLTNPVTWGSSSTGVASINQTGIATGVAAGTTSITAAYTNADGTSAIPGTATLSVQ